MSRRSWGAVAFLALLSLSVSCSSETSLDATPTSLDDARGLAKSVAKSGDCGALEDFDQRDGTWKFTCQNGDGGTRVFMITVTKRPADNPPARPAVRGSHYFITEGDTAHLAKFRGEYLK